MTELPVGMRGLFLFTTVLTLSLLYRATRNSRTSVVVSILWMAFVAATALTGFYRATGTLPPHLLLALAPPLIVIATLFLNDRGRRFVDRMNLKWLILLHFIRVLVEINLFWLYLHKQVPRLLTFEGGNLDILSGLTAPLIYWAYETGRIQRRGLLIWNSLCFLALMNAVGRALLSAPFRFQMFGFSQPTIAILSFPYVMLPAFIVPAVLLSHLSIYRRLLSHTGLGPAKIA
jgi:hypothetical protein